MNRKRQKQQLVDALHGDFTSASTPSWSTSAASLFPR